MTTIRTKMEYDPNQMKQQFKNEESHEITNLKKKPNKLRKKFSNSYQKSKFKIDDSENNATNICVICKDLNCDNLSNNISEEFEMSNSDIYKFVTGLTILQSSSTKLYSICSNCSKSLILCYKFIKKSIESYSELEEVENEFMEENELPSSPISRHQSLPSGSPTSMETEAGMQYRTRNSKQEPGFYCMDENESLKSCDPLLDESLSENIDDFIEQEQKDKKYSQEPIDAVEFLLSSQHNRQVDNKRKTKKLKPKRCNYQCQVCQKTFQRKSNLIDHLRLHANVKPWHCDECGKSFVQAGNLRAHLRTHSKERPYQCKLCPKNYTQSSALNIHIRSHTNEKNYVCDICEKKFTNSSDLGKHKRIHDKSKCSKCEFCDKTFAQKVNLLQHVRRYHAIEYKIQIDGNSE